MKVDTLTPVLRAAPGDRATCRLRIENTESGPLAYRMRIVGFDEANVVRPPAGAPLAAGASEEVDLEFLIPDAFAAGHHSVAVEITSDRPGSAPVIVGVTVSVGSIDEVALAVVPSTIRGRRRGRFRVDIDNRSASAVELDLTGEGPDLVVRLRPDRVQLRPGDRIRTSGRVMAPRHLAGAPRQHSLTVMARSRSAPSYAPATFHQRPLLPRSLRSMLLILLVVAVWAGALGAGFYWLTQGDDVEQSTAPLVDTDGDGEPDTPGDQLVDTDGDGVPDTAAAVVAAEVAAAAEEEPPQEGGSDLPTSSVVGGTVRAGDTGEDADVAVTLTPIDLGAPLPEDASVVGPAGESRGVAKLWPARAPTFGPAGQPEQRETVSVETTSGLDGAWLFGAVSIGRSYELNLAREGFDSQSFVVTPPADGTPITLDVVLEPAEGALSGVVVGPSGPLGNVELVLTDGTLTFATTTASGSGAGTWALDGISTPGTYTLTAMRRGFGTEVLQIALDPGERRDGLTISMTPDVGSIIGRISSGGSPLGGVTLTASTGDVTRTTTSLTEGDRGLYNFPQLVTPGRYTVTASLDGYVTQTRLVTLDGNATGVDFNLVKTTATIEGVVVSVRPDGTSRGRLPNADITVSRDDLSFNSASASPPRATGTFTIDDLPPGTYLVGFSRFDHRSASQLVTVAAGETVILGEVALVFTGGTGIDENGSVEISVVDSEFRPLREATVVLRDVADGREEARQSDAGVGRQSTFRFARVPVGTYEVEVSRDGFSDSSVVVSVGPTAVEREEVVMFELGQVSGRIVDSLDPTLQLDDYTVTIYRVNGGVRDEDPAVLPINVPPDAEPDEDGNVIWATEPRALTSGTYEVVVSRATPGYRVVPDQTLVAGQLPMRFEIDPAGENRPELADIEADPYPNLSGSVLAPQLDDASNAVTFTPINSATLSVNLSCVADPSDEDRIDGVVDEDGLPGLDGFAFTKEQVAATISAADGRDRCLLEINAEGFVAEAIPLRLPASDGTRSPDVVLNVALFQPSAVGGRTYWIDRGAGDAEVSAGGIEVATQGRLIIGFEPARGDGRPPTPVLGPDPLTTTAGPGGFWVYGTAGRPKQVFGRTPYTFTGDGYQPRVISVTIDQAGRRLASVDPPTGLELVDSPGNRIGVELDADGGRIDGNVVIRTIKGTDDFPGSTPNIAGFVMDLAGPEASTTPAVVSGPDSRVGVARVNTVDPGSYVAAMTIPPHHDSLDGRPQTGIDVFQEPGEDVGFIRTYVELGAIDAVVLDAFDDPVPGAQIDVVHVNDPTVDGDPPNFSDGGPVDGDGLATFDDLPVNTGELEAVAARYDVTVEATDFDVDGPAISIRRESGVDEPCGPPTCDAGARLDIRPGGEQTVTFNVAEFGSIVGNVFGQVLAPGDRVALPVGPDLDITAQRVATADGTFLDDPDDPVIVVQDPNTANPNGFSFSGDPGFYTIAVSHPAYLPDPLEVPDPDAILTDPTTGNPVPVFRMSNLTPAAPDPNVIGDPWVLRALPGAVDLTVHTDTITGPGVDGATVAMFGPNDPVLVVDLGGDDTTGPLGTLTVPDLIPGDYRIVVRRTDAAGQDLFFPVIATVNVPVGATPAARTVIVDVPLPRLGAAIEGSVGAYNSEGDPVDFPARDRVPVPAGISVTRVYTPPAVQVEGPTTVPNVATETILSVPAGTEPLPSVDVPSNADGIPQGYEFENIATGVHRLTFADDIVGYTAPVEEVVPVSGLTPTQVDQLNYTALDRSVVIDVTTGGDAVTDATVELTDPDGATTDVLLVDGEYRVSLPPELADYTVTVSKDLHTTTTETFAVEPGDPDTDVVVPVELPPDFARISGLAQQRPSALSTLPLDGTGRVRLIALPDEEEVGSVSAGADGRYLFEIAAIELAEEYRIDVVRPGYARRSSAPFVAVLGDEAEVPTVIVPAFATFNITVNGPPTAAAMSVEIVEPAGQEADSESRAGRVFTFVVDPGTFLVDPGFAYRFRARAPGFVPGDVPPTALVPAPGQTVNRSVTLAERTVSGTIAPDEAGITVVARKDGLERADTTNDAGEYELSNLEAGTWTIIAALPGAGRGTTSVVIDDDDADRDGVDVTLDARPVDMTFTSLPTGAAVVLRDADGDIVASGTAGSGVITADEDLFPLDWTATLAGRVTQNGTVDLDDFDLGDTVDDERLAITVDQITLPPVPTTTTTVSTTTTVAATTTTTAATTSTSTTTTTP